MDVIPSTVGVFAEVFNLLLWRVTALFGRYNWPAAQLSASDERSACGVALPVTSPRDFLLAVELAFVICSFVCYSMMFRASWCAAGVFHSCRAKASCFSTLIINPCGWVLLPLVAVHTGHVLAQLGATSVQISCPWHGIYPACWPGMGKGLLKQGQVCRDFPQVLQVGFPTLWFGELSQTHSCSSFAKTRAICSWSVPCSRVPCSRVPKVLKKSRF